MSGERNDDLAYQALDYIREHPGEWDQRHYFCGTTACFAGRVLIIDGLAAAATAARPARFLRLYGLDPGREAAAKLGWDYEDARSVFHSYTRDFSELERLVKNVLNDEVQDADRR